jgi:hypothetical protein
MCYKNPYNSFLEPVEGTMKRKWQALFHGTRPYYFCFNTPVRSMGKTAGLSPRLQYLIVPCFHHALWHTHQVSAKTCIKGGYAPIPGGESHS